MKAGEQAVRGRLARSGRIVPEKPSISLAYEPQLHAEPRLADIVPSAVVAHITPETLEDAAVAATESAPPVLPLSSLPLSALDRILQPSRQRDRTIWFALAIVVVLHLVALTGAIQLGDAGAGPSTERIGQVDDPTSVEVEMVAAPNKDAKTKESQEGAASATPPSPTLEPQQQPPTPPAPPTPQQQPKPPTEVQKPPEKPAEKTIKAELPKSDTNDDDALMPADPNSTKTEEVKEQQELPQDVSLPPPTPPPPTQKQRIEATSVHGRQSVYVNAVISALSVRSLLEFPVATGNAVVEFDIGPNGTLKAIRISKSSGNKEFDQHVIDFIKTAHLPAPPPSTPEQELTWSYRYVVH